MMDTLELISDEDSGDIGGQKRVFGDEEPCSQYITDVCAQQAPSDRSTQLCVLGLGLNLDGVVASTLRAEIQRNGADHLFIVVLPDRADKRLVGSLARSIRYQLLHSPPRTRELSSGGSPQEGGGGGCDISVPVHTIKEGTGTKERCQVFVKGGVVVTTSKILCADLLHRRLAPEVIAICLMCFPAVGFTRGEALLFNTAVGMGTPLANVAFCIEILLRGTNAGASGDSHGSGLARSAFPRILVLSDHPLWMQYLVSRHQVGRERFTSLLHVGDIQLFPRFRLGIVQHFEKISKTKPLTVDRTLVAVSNDTHILDELLKKVLAESLSGLQSLERRLAPPASSSSTGAGVGFDPGSALAAEADADLRRLQPRVRARFESGPDGAGRRIQYEDRFKRYGAGADARGQKQQHRWTSGTAAWRDPMEPKNVIFDGITLEDAQETETAELDTDLAVALDTNGPTWAFKEQVESLLDVRRLRRALHYGSQYDFIFTLSHVLEKRTRRQRPGELAPPPPSAPWTLSPHFGDIVTVATHRVGRVEERGAAARTETGTAPHLPPEECVIDVDDDGNEDDTGNDPAVSAAKVSAGSAAPRTLALVPNEEEQDTHLHYAHRLALAWVRDQRRRLARRATGSVSDSAPCEDPRTLAPVMLIIVFGGKEVLQMMRRLRYSPEEFRQRQLADFIARYQMYYGIEVVRRSGGHRGDEPQGAGNNTTRQRGKGRSKSTASDSGGEESNAMGVASDTDSDASGLDQDADLDMGFFDAEALLEERNADGDDGISRTPRRNSQLRTQRDMSEHTDNPVGGGGGGGGGGLALHDILLTQTPTEVGPSSPVTDGAGSGPKSSATRGEVQFQVEHSSASLIVLSPSDTPDASEGGASDVATVEPCVAIVDGTAMRTGDLLSLIRGDHSVFGHMVGHHAVRERCTDADGEEEEEEEGAPPHGDGGRVWATAMAVRRILLTRQSVPVLREIETVQDELPASLVERLKVQLVATTFSGHEGQCVNDREKNAFQLLANTKASLTGRMLMDRSSVRRTEEMLEAGLAVQSRSAAGGVGGAVSITGRTSASRRKMYVNIGGQFIGGVEPKTPESPLVIFDEREFRSMLPFHLYTHGIDLVPLTLNTADYVLSPQYGLERKSVSDFFQSILGHGRINEQLTALSRRYESALLLIEFDRARPFRLLTASTGGAGMSGGGRSGAQRQGYSGAASLYVRMAKMVAAHPSVSLLWSRSPAHSAGMISTLKLTVAERNPDPSDGSLTGGLYGSTVRGGGGDSGESEAAKAIQHYAMRVLARFPGVHAGNADKVMRLCGSLAGLAAVSKDSLVRAIGEEDGTTLFEFLHSPFVEQID